MAGVLLHRFNNEQARGDIAQDATAFFPFTGNLSKDEGLISVVEVSVFTDRRHEDGAELPGGPLDLRGWWGDEYFGPSFDLPQHKIGSLIWTLDRSKNRAATLKQLKDYAVDAVAWMVDLGIFESVTGFSERLRADTGVFQLELQKPGEPDSLWTPRWEKTISGL